jgi:pyruvate,water dikinase
VSPRRPGDGRASAGGRLRDAWRALRRRAAPAGTSAEAARFRLMYERFREILALNDSTLQVIADIEDRLSGRAPFALDAMVQRVRKAAMDVFVMVKDLNQLAANRHAELYDALRAVSAGIEAICPAPEDHAGQPLVIPLADLRLQHVGAAGTKMAHLGEIRACARLAVPDGFVITTAASAAFMAANELWGRAERLESLLETREDAAALSDACREVADAIVRAPVPEGIADAILGAYDALFAGADVPVAMRSSAVGEDTQASHAGQYHTELGVSRARLLDAYRAVLASAYNPSAVAYRFEHGMTAYEATMAVGCVSMLSPRCSGIMFSRRPEAPAAESIVVSAVPGLSDGVASGEHGAQVWVVGDAAASPNSSLLSNADLLELLQAARRLERCFGGPQEIEWAREAPDALYILQSRPMVVAPAPRAGGDEPLADDPPLLVGGLTACPGVGAGPAVFIRRDEELDSFPDGGVLVARHSSPTFSRVMARCAAIVTDVGSPTGHMASLAREYAVPAIVGAGRATSFLQPGEPVTVDATRRQVFAGILVQAHLKAAPDAPVETPALLTLRRIARLVTPLALTDPASREFRPRYCRSLHDITRFVHEKAFEVMFHYGDLASSDTHHARTLAVRLPLTIHVFDVGGGLREGLPDGNEIAAADVASEPLKAFLSGMLDPRLRWDRPRPLSARGFLSVLGESMAGPPPEALKVGRASYAIVSDRYLNFSTKAGYHFSTIDTYCGASLNKNYIHFRFAGGAADSSRRARRVRFISAVLSHLDFTVQTRSDLLVARMQKYDRDTILARLVALGQLTMCARQLDMLMDSESSPEFFARAFIADELEKF